MPHRRPAEWFPKNPNQGDQAAQGETSGADPHAMRTVPPSTVDGSGETERRKRDVEPRRRTTEKAENGSTLHRSRLGIAGNHKHREGHRSPHIDLLRPIDWLEGFASPSRPTPGALHHHANLFRRIGCPMASPRHTDLFHHVDWPRKPRVVIILSG